MCNDSMREREHITAKKCGRNCGCNEKVQTEVAWTCGKQEDVVGVDMFHRIPGRTVRHVFAGS